MNRSYTTKQIDRRFRGVLGSVRKTNIQPTADVIRELAELAQALEDEPVRVDPVARLTVTRANNEKLIVEIYDDATFSSFYVFYRQEGNRRSTKTHIRTAGRSDAPGLESLAFKLTLYQRPANPIRDMRLTIYRKTIYRRLLTARPDELGLTRTVQIPWRRFELAGWRS